MSRTMGLVARAGGVLAAVGTVVVGSVARPVVVVVVALEERVVRRTVGETTADAHTAAAVAISDEGVSLLRIATERHGDGVALRVAAAHRLAPPVLSHDNSFWSRAENEFSAKWDASSPMALGETPTLADAKADTYKYQLLGSLSTGIYKKHEIYYNRRMILPKFHHSHVLPR